MLPLDVVSSYANVMAVPDAINGFVTGYGIAANERGGVTTAQVVRADACQVSTTIFRAAWSNGLSSAMRTRIHEVRGYDRSLDCR
jgi:vancomycin resistance protein YoaR